MAVEETLRRLTAKALLATVSEDMTRYFRPTPLEYWRTHSCEAIVHAIRRWLQKHNNDEARCLLTVDLENAFNQIDRSCFLPEVRRAELGAARHSDQCYSNDSFVSFGLEKIPSQREVQQGDPLGPLLFALGPHGAISEGRARAGAVDSPFDKAPLLPRRRDRLRSQPPPSSTFASACWCQMSDHARENSLLLLCAQKIADLP